MGIIRAIASKVTAVILYTIMVYLMAALFLGPIGGIIFFCLTENPPPPWENIALMCIGYVIYFCVLVTWFFGDGKDVSYRPLRGRGVTRKKG
jgi:hypothetical protein